MAPRKKKTTKAIASAASAGPAGPATKTKAKPPTRKGAASRSRMPPAPTTNASAAGVPAENGGNLLEDEIEAAPVPTLASLTASDARLAKPMRGKHGGVGTSVKASPLKPASKKRVVHENGAEDARVEAPAANKPALGTKDGAKNGVAAVDANGVVESGKAVGVGKKRGGAVRQTGRPAKVQKTAAGKRDIGRARVLAKPVYADVWKEVYLAGTEWDQMKDVYGVDWDFEHLDHALSSGDLAMRDVYLFGATEPQLLMRDENDDKGGVLPIPVIIAVVSDIPPPSTVGIKSVQRTTEEIVPMSELRMMWQKYAPPNVVHRAGCKSYVHVLTCSQRKARLRHMKNEAVHRYDYVLPYIFNPDKQEDVDENTEVQVLADLEGLQAPLMCTFDYEMDELDEFVDEKLTEDDLDVGKYAEGLKKAIQDAVKATKQKYKAEREDLKKKVEAISAEEREAIKKMKVIKFYPLNEWPDISKAKSTYVNRYYGHANEVRDDVPDQ